MESDAKAEQAPPPLDTAEPPYVSPQQLLQQQQLAQWEAMPKHQVRGARHAERRGARHAAPRGHGARSGNVFSRRARARVRAPAHARSRSPYGCTLCARTAAAGGCSARVARFPLLTPLAHLPAQYVFEDVSQPQPLQPLTMRPQQLQPLPMQPQQLQPLYFPVHPQQPQQQAYFAPVQMQPFVQRRVVGQRLKGEGWCCVIVLAFVFWPAMCIPCCLPGCQEDVYEDVYVMPDQLAAPMPFMMPANAGMGMPMPMRQL
jgi:hypothetical protein